LGASSAYRIIKKVVKLFPYKIQMQQNRHEADKARRVGFCYDFKRSLEDSQPVPQNTWFSDEAHFHLNGYMSRQNMYVWASDHQHNILETPLHWKNMWDAVSASGITVFTSITLTHIFSIFAIKN
jgi:hypothetical protein